MGWQRTGVIRQARSHLRLDQEVLCHVAYCQQGPYLVYFRPYFFTFVLPVGKFLMGPKPGAVELSCILKATRHVFSWGKTHVRQALFGYELSINETTIHPG